MKHELKKLPIEAGRFEANGKNYVIETGFSIERYSMYQKLQLEAGFGITFEEMVKNWEKVESYANALRFVDIAVTAHNMKRGVSKIAEREPVLLKMCALFINHEDEDRRTITDDQIAEKLVDWQTEGFDVKDFFTLALNTINGFIDAWKKITQTITETEHTTKASL
jgi:hypothetical protein